MYHFASSLQLGRHMYELVLWHWIVMLHITEQYSVGTKKKQKFFGSKLLPPRTALLPLVK